MTSYGERLSKLRCQQFKNQWAWCGITTNAQMWPLSCHGPEENPWPGMWQSQTLKKRQHSNEASRSSYKDITEHDWHQSNSQLLGVLGLSGTCSSKIAPSPLRIVTQRNILFIETKPSYYFKRHVDRFSHFACSQMLCCTMHCQRRRKTVKTAPSSLDFVALPEEDRATAIGNMHKKFGKDRGCGSEDIFADRQTDRQTHRHDHRNTSLPRKKL